MPRIRGHLQTDFGSLTLRGGEGGWVNPYILYILLLSNCLKGYTKGRLPVPGDTLTYNPYSRTKTITIQNSKDDTITKLNNKRAYTIQLQN